MQYSATSIEGFFKIRNEVFKDNRGTFNEWFVQDDYSDFYPAQANVSFSQKGVIRGIHYSTAPEGQSNLVICTSGRIKYVAVDLRQDSPTYGKHHVVELSGRSGNAVFLAEGLGHAFEVLSETATIVYLLSSKYNKDLEKEINPLDKQLNIPWVTTDPILSEKDKNAPSFMSLTQWN